MEKPLVYMRLRGPIASFRYPYLLVGRQPTYLLPPLSTIYGLLQAAYGQPYNPSDLQVGYLFHAEPALSIDLEKVWFLEKQEGGGKRAKPVKDFTSNVLPRELRVDVTLELFLAVADVHIERWYQALRSPKFWVYLGPLPRNGQHRRGGPLGRRRQARERGGLGGTFPFSAYLDVSFAGRLLH